MLPQLVFRVKHLVASDVHTIRSLSASGGHEITSRVQFVVGIFTYIYVGATMRQQVGLQAAFSSETFHTAVIRAFKWF